MVAVGLALTVALAWAARMAHVDNEQRLLDQRAREAAATLAATIPSIEISLATTAAIPRVIEEGNLDVFERTLGTQVGPDRRFASAAVWTIGEPQPSVVLGSPPALATRPQREVQAFFERAREAGGMSIFDLLDEEPARLGYASSPEPDGESLVYAETELPPARTSTTQPGSAFGGLDYVIYLQMDGEPERVVLSSTPALPLEGRRAEELVPFGDAGLRLEMAPIEELGGSLLAQLQWIVLAMGAAVTAGGALVTHQIQRRRLEAEQLAEENRRLYAEQRDASVMLQLSLLPSSLPEVSGLEVAVRYCAGVEGTQVGGDWYDVVVDGDRAVAVIGDVSGRGLPAASVMASIRHSIRALAAQGDRPEVILGKVNALDARERGGHFATVLLLLIDPGQGTISIASAGHPAPLMVSPDGAEWMTAPTGPPIGTMTGHRYKAATMPAPLPGSTVLLFTDGLFERRGESIDVGLDRLRAVAGSAGGSLQVTVDDLVDQMTDGEAPDDAAVLALRWSR